MSSLGGTCVVWGSIWLAWVILGWFVVLNGLGLYWAGFRGKWMA